MNIDKSQILLMTVSACLSCSSLAAEPELISSGSERILKRKEVTKELGAGILKNWTIRHPEMLKLSKGGRDEAVLTIRQRLDYGELDKRLFPCITYTNPLNSRADLSFELPPETFTEYNQLSVWVYPDAPQRTAIWFDMLGAGTVQCCCPLRGQEWNKISICWSNTPDDTARKIKGLSFGHLTMGRLPGDPEFVDLYYKDFVLEKVVTGSENTWAASPEKIIIPQTGYAPNDNKRALLSGRHSGEDFVVLNESGIVFQGKLREESHRGETFKVADFSDLRTPGTYQVRSGNLISVPFAISYQHLDDLARKSRHFMFCMRSGMETPAHPVCFLDDAIRSDNRQAVDVSGGWFDASDLCGFFAMSMNTVMRPMAMACRYNTPPEIYDEARWGAKLLNKLYDPETKRPFTVMSHFSVYRHAAGLNKIVQNIQEGNIPKNADPLLVEFVKNRRRLSTNIFWTDNLPGTGDERVVHVSKENYISYHDRVDMHWGMTAAAGYFGRIAGEKDCALSKEITTKYQPHFDLINSADKETLSRNGIGFYSNQLGRSLLLRLESAIGFHRATGEERYAKLAGELVERLLKNQQHSLFQTDYGYLTGFFCSSQSRHSTDSESLASGSFGYVLSQYAEEFADRELYLKLTAALRIYSDFYLCGRASLIQPYSIPYHFLTEKKQDNVPQIEVGRHGERILYGNFGQSFISTQMGMRALDALSLAIFLRDQRLQHTASEQLRYHTGENPAGRSFTADVGVNFNRAIMSTVLGWIPGMLSNPVWENGVAVMPYNRNCARYEIYTQGQASYTVAASLLNAPARITLSCLNLPPNCSLRVTDLTLKETVKAFPAVSANETFELPGGTRYRFEFGNGLAFEEDIMSAELKNLSIDMEHFLKLDHLTVPKETAAGEIIKATCRVYYFGKAPATVKLTVAGQNLSGFKPVTLTLQPGKTVETPINGKTSKAGEPYVLMVYPEDSWRQTLSAAGAVQ